MHINQLSVFWLQINFPETNVSVQKCSVFQLQINFPETNGSVKKCSVFWLQINFPETNVSVTIGCSLATEWFLNLKFWNLFLFHAVYWRAPCLSRLGTFLFLSVSSATTDGQQCFCHPTHPHKITSDQNRNNTYISVPQLVWGTVAKRILATNSLLWLLCLGEVLSYWTRQSR